MGADQNFDWRSAAASALEWWRDAGVDTLVEDAPVDWLAPPSPASVPLVATGAMPGTPEAFAAWRTGPDAPEADWQGKRLAPEGDPAAAFWVFTDLPEREDLAAGRLLSGAQGKLFERMLAAVGLARGAVHLVPLCTARPVAGRIGAAMEKQLGEVARAYIGLARPRRVLLLGEAASRYVLGMSCRDARGSLRAINHAVGQSALRTEVVASLHPRMLIERPTAKADAWRDLRLWTEDRV